MHVFAVPEFWCEHIDEKLTRKKNITLSVLVKETHLVKGGSE